MLVLVDEMTKQRSLGYAERAFMGEVDWIDVTESLLLLSFEVEDDEIFDKIDVLE
jgi:hypothetical protein